MPAPEDNHLSEESILTSDSHTIPRSHDYPYESNFKNKSKRMCILKLEIENLSKKKISKFTNNVVK